MQWGHTKAEHYLLRGNSVRFVTPADEPQGAVVSQVAPQALSGGHRNAAAPMSEASAAYTPEAIRLAVASKLVNTFMEGILFPKRQVSCNKASFQTLRWLRGSLLKLKLDRRGVKRETGRMICSLHLLYTGPRAQKLAVLSVLLPCTRTNP